MKGESFDSNTFEYFLEAFSTILTPHPTAESLRSLALFVTYALHSPKNREGSVLTPSKSIKRKDGVSHRRQTLTSNPSNPTSSGSNVTPGLSRQQIGVKVLYLYTTMLCGGKDVTNIKRFARTVTNRVSRYINPDQKSRH